MTKILHNSTRYLEPYIVEKCFSKGKVTHVDKQVCGNGFSTRFLELSPPLGKVNIIIAPNKAVVIAKEIEYNKGNLQGFNRIKFFYAESNEVNFYDAEVLVFVADSFLAMKDKVKDISHSIDKVLIDEYHSVEIQSLFRLSLVDFLSKVKSICPDPNTSIATVTASPNLFSKVDVLITNELINPNTINVSKDRAATVKRIKADIKNNIPTVVCTNSATAIYKIFHNKNKKKTITANFIIGVTLTRSLCELIEIKPDVNSNLTIVSSRGFEGFDIDYKDANVYFLEDRSNEFEHFFISNLYQAINRVRAGASYIEYNRLELSNKRKEPFADIDADIDKFVNDTSISVENKQRSEYKKYHPFVIFEPDNKGRFSIKKNKVSINLHKETLLFDNTFPSPDFKNFLETRLITINDLSDVNNRLFKKVRLITKEKTLLKNKDLIKATNVFGTDYKIQIKELKNDRIKVPTFDNRVLYLAHLKKYLRCKNYDQTRIPSERENIALTLLSDESKYLNLMTKITKAYDTRSISKYGAKASLNYRNDFKNKCFNIVCKWILAFANPRITVPSKWIANRDYNIGVGVGVNEIRLIGEMFGATTNEIDIRNCFPRVLYGLNGLKLPADFYGEKKKKKLPINIAINNFFYDSSLPSSKSVQKSNSIRTFRNLGFNEVVINYLITIFFEARYKGDLFNFLAFHEKNIITKIKDDLINLDSDGVIRRHDSVLIFNNRSDLSFLNNFEFLGVNGWFDIKEIPIIKLSERKLLSEDVAEFNVFLEDLKKNSLYMAL
jgi:hypothetical protein